MATDQPPMVVELTVSQEDDDLLAELVQAVGGSDDVTFGPLRDVAADTQLYFDLAAAAEVVKSVTAVMSGALGVAKVIDFVVSRLKSKKRIVVTVGSTSVVVTGDNNPDQIRAALRAAMKLV